MAYARFARDSDVYVYADAHGGFTCQRCPGAGHEFRCSTATEMVSHLELHRAKGHRVPQDELDALSGRRGGETAPDNPILAVLFSDDRTRKAEISLTPEGLYQVVAYREVVGDGEFEPKAYWSPMGKRIILADTMDRATNLANQELCS